MNSQYGFFNTHNNDLFHSIQGAYILSSTSFCHNNSIKGSGTYMYPPNLRRSISLFCARSLPKHSWKNSNDVYIGRIENE